MPAIDHTRLSYRLDGRDDAPVLVLGNSLGTDGRLWDAQVETWQRDFRVLRFALPGHGGAAAWTAPFDMGALAEALRALLDALAIARCHYCGLSMGGAIGLELAARAPERVQGLVLSNTAAQFGDADFWRQRLARARAEGLMALFEASSARWLTPAQAEAEPHTVALLGDMFSQVKAEGYLQCGQAVMDFDFRPRLASLAVPALVIAGTHDLATTPQQGRALHDGLRASRYLELPVAHLGNLGAPMAFADAVTRFATST